MLIYGVSGIFANKKTIKQFFQAMIEQVGGGGGVLNVMGGCAAFLTSAFSVATVFLCWFFSMHRCPFWGQFVPFLLYIMCISSKSQTVFWAQHFRDVQLIPNLLRYPSCL